MKRLFGKKSKKSPNPPTKHISPVIPANITARPLGPRAELDAGPDDEGSNRDSRIVFQDNSAEGKELPAPEVSTSGVAVVSTDHRSDPTRENATDTGEGESGVKPAGVSKVPERGYKNTALRATTTLSGISKETADESGPLGPLKAVLRIIAVVYYANDQETTAIGKIEYLLSRVVALEERFYSHPDDVVEQRHRGKLIREFGRIEGQLRFLSKKPGPEQLAGHTRYSEEVYRLLEDLREAIFDYQMVQQMEIYNQRCKLIKPAEAAVLNNFSSAKAATYRHGDRKGCLKGTRGTVLDEIEQWARDSDRPPVYWLNGLAGTGKSTIAQTITERIFADGQLGASFFCSRDFQDRRDLKFIFPTIAVQLARNYPEFRSVFVPLVQSDPEIAHESLYNQMDRLIVWPLKQSGIPTVIIIDALDECKDEEPASAILSVLGRFVSQIPKVKFLVTEATDVFALHEVESSRVNSDIQLFFRHNFSELRGRRRGLDDWPSSNQLDLLCERAAGLFVYATATVKFIDHKTKNPKKQLECILQLPTSSAHEGKTRLGPNTTLDSLYMSILQEAFDNDDDDPEGDSMVRSVLGAVILAANPLSPSTIAALLCVDPEDVFLRLSSIHSLLILQEDTDSPVRPFHKSFPDFIVDPTRCINERFHVSPPNHHPELLAGCLELMNQRLEKNMCNLPNAVANREVDDLRERTKQYLDPSLRYACKSWHEHLIDGHIVRTPAIASALGWFLEVKFLFWLEVLSVLGATREAVDALDVAAKWLEVSPTLDLVIDCLRFVMGFFGIISTSCPHIYHSALPLCPRNSIVRSLYEPHARPLARVVHGLPNSWESSIAAMGFPSWIHAAVWSPCSRFIAISRGDAVEIMDAVTLERVTTHNPPLDYAARQLVFSPNTRLLTWYGGHPTKLMSWDLQTGGLVSSIALRLPEHIGSWILVTYSTCGTMVAGLYHDRRTFTIFVCNVLFGTHTYPHSAEGRPLANVWTHGKYLRFATTGSGSITTWEVEFASPHTPTRVKFLPIPDDFDPQEKHQLHPTSSRLAFATKWSLVVWDAQHSKFLLEFTGADYGEFTSMSFSSDGRSFACGVGRGVVHLWKESPTGYTLHQKFTPNTSYLINVLVSPDGESIIASDSSTILLWRTADSITSLSDISTLTVQRNEYPFVLGLSDEGLAAVARRNCDMVTVLDLESGTARLTIDTGMGVYAVGVDGSAVVVVGEENIVTWSLPAGNNVLNPRTGVNDSVLTTTFNCLSMLDDTLKPISVSPDLRRIAIIGWYEDDGSDEDDDDYQVSLRLYDVPTGNLLASELTDYRSIVSFSPDGREVWADNGSGWKIVEDSESDVIRLEPLESSAGTPGWFPWGSPRGYQVTDDGWVLSPSGKQLLWLPPSWRFDRDDIMWSGRFLALLGSKLPEPVILELEE
ncbi:WD40 repeat-like protein [Thelephora ganbajun]|uniref:WD40 repeat-like protein n=1 Tax=Thelephora ganbajun TaxID=370292 RepID=A0ACB6Z027_THEGA|nr:WD40 repeat-like protein [Thelephora ganbajun]